MRPQGLRRNTYHRSEASSHWKCRGSSGDDHAPHGSPSSRARPALREATGPNGTLFRSAFPIRLFGNGPYYGNRAFEVSLGLDRTGMSVWFQMTDSRHVCLP
jgi:hypothetical protein